MTDVRLLGWTAQGLRCPDHEVSLTRPGDIPYHVSLIQMPNGTGKTTTLELIRAALSGPGVWTDPQSVAEFAPHGTAGEDGKFDVRLMVDGERRFTIEMTFRFDTGKVDFHTTWRGVETEFLRPEPLLRVLTPEFVPFFVFDGELAPALLDPKKTQAREALEVQFQLTSLNHFSVLMEQYWEDRTRNSTVKSEKGLTQRINRLDELNQRHNLLAQEQEQLNNNLLTQTSRKDKIAGEYNKHFDQDSQAQAEAPSTR